MRGGYAQSVNCLNPWDAQSIRQYSPDGVFSSLSAGTGGGQNRAGVCYALQGNGIDRKIENGCNGKGFRENEMYTLDVVDRHAVVYEPKSAMDENWHEAEVKNAIRANASKSSHAIVYDARGNGNGKTVPTLTGDHQNRVTDYTSVLVTTNKPPRRYIVRRLTPLECCRLQGFSDGWGDTTKKDGFNEEEYRFWLAVRQTKESINGREPKHYTAAQMLAWYNKLHTDSAEYKMWGNGIALPCAVFVLGGVVEAMQAKQCENE